MFLYLKFKQTKINILQNVSINMGGFWMIGDFDDLGFLKNGFCYWFGLKYFGPDKNISITMGVYYSRSWIMVLNILSNYEK